MNFFRALISPPQPIPTQYKANFFHLFSEIAWFGLLNGSTLAFIVVYATRLGASPVQVGLLNASAAIVNLAFALPAGQWLSRLHLGKAVFWSSAIGRAFYLGLVALPLIFKTMPKGEIWAIVIISLVMNIPLTVIMVGFNALFAEAVPDYWRGYVAGRRNALLSLVSVIANLVSGIILVNVAFPMGYQIVFLLGFVGAAASSYHLFHLRAIGSRPVLNPEGAGYTAPVDLAAPTKQAAPAIQATPTKLAAPAMQAAPTRLASPAVKPGKLNLRQTFRLDILKGPFGRVAGLLFAFHFAQYLAIPIFPLFTVNVLKFNDQTLSLGAGLFNAFVFLGSLQLARLTTRMGNKRLVGLGVTILSLYPFLIGLAHGESLYLIASVIGGLAWAMTGGALFNYLLEHTPESDRTGYLAWYNMAFNAAVLFGSLGGPALGSVIGLGNALLVTGGLRLLAGIAILRWG